MKQYTFIITGKIRRYLHSIFLLMLVLCISSCKSEEDEAYYVKMGITETDVLTGEKADKLIDADFIWNNSKGGSMNAFFLYSNLPEWNVVTELETDSEWIEIWPGEGSRDGRFYVKVHPNTTPDERASSLNIVYNGEVYRAIPIVQSAAN